MNSRNSTGLVGYRTPTPSAHNPARLLRGHAKMSPGQAAITRAQLVEMNDGNAEPQWEDVEQRLNRRERRVVEGEARAHKKALARKAALKKQRADQRAKKNARALVEL